MNLADYNSCFDLFSVYLNNIDHLNLKILILIGILQVLRYDFQAFRILIILNFHPSRRGVGDKHMSCKAGVTGSIPGFSIKPLSVEPLGVPVKKTHTTS